MKQVYLILLLWCFSLFAYSVSNDIDNIGDFLSEEDCMRIDSLFTLYSLVTIDSGIFENKIRYKIYDISGLLVNSGLNNGQNIDVSTLPTGLYTLFVEDENKNIVINGYKIIKQ